MGMGHPMQQYPVQMPTSYGQPSYVPTMPQLLPQQMMQPNFQNFQQVSDNLIWFLVNSTSFSKFLQIFRKLEYLGL